MLRFKHYLMEQSMYKHLTAGELLKPGREGRGITVVNKINDGEEFLLHAGGTVRLKKDAETIKKFKSALDVRDAKTLNTITFEGQDGKTYMLKHFSKSPEFGGKGAGSGTRAEDEALTAFKKELFNVLQDENVPKRKY